MEARSEIIRVSDDVISNAWYMVDGRLYRRDRTERSTPTVAVMACGIVRGAISTVLDDHNLVKSTRSDKMRQFGKNFLTKIVEANHEVKVFDQFCESITSDMDKILGSIPPRIRSPSSKRAYLWSTFHEQRHKQLFKPWQDLFSKLGLEGDQLFVQSVNQELFQQMLANYFSKESVRNHLKSNNLQCPLTN